MKRIAVYCGSNKGARPEYAARWTMSRCDFVRPRSGRNGRHRPNREKQAGGQFPANPRSARIATILRLASKRDLFSFAA